MLLVVKGVLDQFAILSLAGGVKCDGIKDECGSWWLACFSTGLISTIVAIMLQLCSAGFACSTDPVESLHCIRIL